MLYQLRKRARVSYAPAEDDDEIEDEILDAAEDSNGEESQNSASNLEETPAMRKKRTSATEEKKRTKKSSQAPDDKSLPSNKIFPFLKLPPELRNTIYRLCLLPGEKGPLQLDFVTRNHCYLAIQRGNFAHPFNFVKPSVKILQLNSAIHDEAASLLYAQEIHFTNHDVAQAFIAQIGVKNRERLRCIRLNNDGRSAPSRQLYFAFSALAHAPNVETLHIQSSLVNHAYRSCTDNPVLDGTKAAKKLCRQAIHWFETMAMSKGTPFAGLDVLELDRNLFYCSDRLPDMSADCTVTNGYTYLRPRLSSEDSKKLQLRREGERIAAFRNEVKRILSPRFKNTLA